MAGKRDKYPPESMIGKEFGQLTVIALDVARSKQKGARYYLCKCECGNDHVALGYLLRSNQTSRCYACFIQSKENRKVFRAKFGRHRFGHPIWHDWMVMRRQCINPLHPGYKYYGALGIKVCDRWKSFQAFCEDMGEDKPINTHLVRLDTTKDFYKENCKWGQFQETEGYKRRKERARGQYYARKERARRKKDQEEEGDDLFF